MDKKMITIKFKKKEKKKRKKEKKKKEMLTPSNLAAFNKMSVGLCWSKTLGHEALGRIHREFGKSEESADEREESRSVASTSASPQKG
jgi:hypothetical protein